MQMITEFMGLATVRKSLRFTVAVLKASGRHGDLAIPVAQLVAEADKIAAARLVAEDLLTESNARVRWLALSLDECVRRFAAHVLAECGGRRDHHTFKKFFVVSPSEINRMALEAELAFVKRWHDVILQVPLGEAATGVLEDMKKLEIDGTAALVDREEANVGLARVSLKVVNLRLSANQVRRGVFDQLAVYATTHSLDRSYGEAFFFVNKAEKAAGAKGRTKKGTDDSGDDG